jgi:hypothetical protein
LTSTRPPAQPVQKAQKARITPQTTLNMEKLCKDQAALRYVKTGRLDQKNRQSVHSAKSDRKAHSLPGTARNDCAQPVQKAQKARITPQTTLNMEKLCKDQAALRYSTEIFHHHFSQPPC